MKLFFQILGLLLFSFLYSSCQDPCEDVDCYNGGWCDDGDCECPPGVYGSECQFRDATCTCTFDPIMLDGVNLAPDPVTTNCSGCNPSQIEAFEQSCADADEVMIDYDGNSLGSCVLD